ncbi:MAG: NADH-quinone oxidoreductase subunit J [Elusimicrobia bacterium]|nr:NADH-quinone oxidoreductase subunit J [Elusimicrobiota bacterium]
MTPVLFYLLAGILLCSAICTVTLRNIVHAALFLGLALTSVAGLFAMLEADFLFSAQLLIYVGGIAVLILFVVLLSGRREDLHARQLNEQWLGVFLVCLVSCLALWKVYAAFSHGLPGTSPPSSTTQPLGKLLLTEYLVPFELISLILLAALLGAVYFTKSEP